MGRITLYFEAAMSLAAFEEMEGNEGWLGAIPEFDGLWATAPTEAECRVTLRRALEERVLVNLQHHTALPVLANLDLNLADGHHHHEKP